MPALPEPIILTITDAGKHAALEGEYAGLSIQLTQLAYGAGKYDPTGNETSLLSEINRSNIVSGDVEKQSNTLRFSSTLYADEITDIYEIGVFSAENTLFAVASSTSQPLLRLYPKIAFVGGFGLTLGDLNHENVTVRTDPNGALSLVIMEQHLAAPDPHPQYLNKARFSIFLEAAFPYGYKHWSHNNENPKPLFDGLFGYETFWRRLKGVHLIAVDESRQSIKNPMMYVGQDGDVEANDNDPDHYTGYTSFLWERYDPEHQPFRYDDHTLLDSKAIFI